MSTRSEKRFLRDVNGKLRIALSATVDLVEVLKAEIDAELERDEEWHSAIDQAIASGREASLDPYGPEIG